MIRVLLYRLSSFIVRVYLRVFFRVKLVNKQNQPYTGPGIVIANHQHWLDILAIGGLVRGRMHFLAKQELWSNRLASWYFTKIGCIPVNRGHIAPSVIKQSIDFLKEGCLLCIFPEGTRSQIPGTLLPFEPLVAKLAARHNCPVYPVGIDWRNNDPLSLTITHGKPLTITIAQGEDRARAIDQETRRLERIIADLCGKKVPSK